MMKEIVKIKHVLILLVFIGLGINNSFARIDTNSDKLMVFGVEKSDNAFFPINNYSLENNELFQDYPFGIIEDPNIMVLRSSNPNDDEESTIGGRELPVGNGLLELLLLSMLYVAYRIFGFKKKNYIISNSNRLFK